MAKEKRTYRVEVDYRFGPVETYSVEATSAADARKKAKKLYMADYFRRSYIKTFIYD